MPIANYSAGGNSTDSVLLFVLQLTGASPELIYRLMPEHLRRQNGILHPVGA